MSRGFIFGETDYGTKRKCRLALSRTSKKLNQKFIVAMKNYWWRVYETTKRLCINMGVFDTLTLYKSIRLIWEYEPTGGLFEVAVSSVGVDMVAMIKVGGGTHINPKTGRVVDYAQAVHDGTRYIRGRPFLMLAIYECEPYLQSILTRSVDGALREFVRG